LFFFDHQRACSARPQFAFSMSAGDPFLVERRFGGSKDAGSRRACQGQAKLLTPKLRARERDQGELAATPELQDAGLVLSGHRHGGLDRRCAESLDAFHAKSRQRRQELALGRANAIEKPGVARRPVNPILRRGDRPLQIICNRQNLVSEFVVNDSFDGPQAAERRTSLPINIRTTASARRSFPLYRASTGGPSPRRAGRSASTWRG